MCIFPDNEGGKKTCKTDLGITETGTVETAYKITGYKVKSLIK